MALAGIEIEKKKSQSFFQPTKINPINKTQKNKLYQITINNLLLSIITDISATAQFS